MQKADLKILIIEDDPSLGRALDEGFKRSGYTTQLVTNYTQAKNSTKLSEFHGFVVDCMLPQKNGVELIQELILDHSSDPVIVLTSGIFKDKNYVADAMRRTKAKAFVTKPFDIEELLQRFDQAFAHLVDEEKEPLSRLLTLEQYSVRDKLSAIANTEYNHGFDLALIYSLLMDNQITGELHIEYDDKPKSIIGFNRGRIDKVVHHDTESYFGVLLIEKGFTTPEALEQGLNTKSNKPIGERLVELSSVSPHAIEIVQLEQMIIRLSKTLQDTSVKANFLELEKNEPSVYIDEFQFSQLLSDWLCSKISPIWLRTYYMPWMEHPIMRGPAYKKVELLKHLPATRTLAQILLQQNWPHRLQDLLSAHPSQEEEILRGLHFFISMRCLHFAEKFSGQENFDIKRARLEKIWETIQTQNLFEILGVSQRARPTEIHRAYQEMAKNLHPDKLPPTAPNDIKELAQKIFSRISDAHQTLSQEDKRKNYLKTLELGYADEILQSETTFEEAIRLLKGNHFREARKTFERNLKMKGHRSDTIVYLIWALLKEKRHRANRYELAEYVAGLLNKVSHEDRHSPHYFFVKGMYYELGGQVEKAYNHFKHCIILDPTFADAKRELAHIKRTYEKKTNTFTDDMSQIFTNIFKRKSG